MAEDIIEEFIKALDEEIEDIKSNKANNIIRIFNGRLIRKAEDAFIYVFKWDNTGFIIEDSPAEIDIRGRKYHAQILSVQGMEIEISIEYNCGQAIDEAYLELNPWYLLELLKQKYIGCINGAIKADFNVSKAVFSGKYSNNRREPVELRYTVGNHPPNEAQRRAIKASLSSGLCIIWGPPGTGKTKTIAHAIEAHLNAGRRVLLVSHANNAVDEALLDVVEQLKDSSFYKDGQLIRFGQPREKYLNIYERDYELVLLNKVAAKFSEPLSKERDSLDLEKASLNKTLLKFEQLETLLQEVKTLSKQLSDLKNSISENRRQLTTLHSDIQHLEEKRQSNLQKLDEAKNSSPLKRFFKRLDPKLIQSEIDTIEADLRSKRQSASNISQQLDNINVDVNVKQKSMETAKAEIDSILRPIGISENHIESKYNELRQRMSFIEARISEINRTLSTIKDDIFRSAKLIATTLTKTFTANEFMGTSFDTIILDEASMAPLPHFYWAISRGNRFVTIVGDFLQLPPICTSDKPMAKKWLGRNIFNVLEIDTVDKANANPIVKLLDTQYRMHPDISAIPNTFFYKNCLHDHPSTYEHTLDDGLFSDSPLVLIETSSIRPWCRKLSSGSRFNLYHALLSISVAERIINHSTDINIGITAPYVAQARLIAKLANDHKLLDRTQISTVHRFQGGEESVIIFDSTDGLGTKVSAILDDTIKDSNADLLLNVAITRAKSRFYLIGNTEYLLLKLNKASSMAGIIHYLYDKAKIINCEDLLDNYVCIHGDYKKWMAILKPATSIPPNIANTIIKSRNFWPLFLLDLQLAQKSITIINPSISDEGVVTMLDWFQTLKIRGLDIQIFTNSKGLSALNAIKRLNEMSINATTRSNIHQNIIIIDNSILWEGNINILNFTSSDGLMRRFEAPLAAQEIIKYFDLNDKNAEGTITDMLCPKCGRPMIVRKSRYGKFLGCSNYPKCKGKLNISL